MACRLAFVCSRIARYPILARIAPRYPATTSA